MEVILKKDMKSLGYENEIVQVKDGYGRNYLIPRGIAILATTNAKKVHAENMKQKTFKEERIRSEAQSLAEQIGRKKLTIGAKTSSTGKIFGSVNTIQLAEALAKKGFELDRKIISIKEDSVKEVGTYTAIVKLHKDISVEIAFDVVSE